MSSLRLVALLLGAALSAQAARRKSDPLDGGPRPPPPPEARAPLSEEDQKVVRELALLEQLELVRNLELFDAGKDPGKDEAPAREPARK